MIVKFLGTVLLLTLPYFFGGMALAILFRTHHDELPRLYMADLLGASGGVLLAILAMNHLGTPLTAVWVALPVLLAALLAGGRWRAVFPVVLISALDPRQAPMGSKVLVTALGDQLQFSQLVRCSREIPKLLAQSG